MIWIAEEEVRRLKETMHARRGPLTPSEHQRFIRTATMLDKLRKTEAELMAKHNPDEMDDISVDDEFRERCLEQGLDPDKVARVFEL